MEDFEGAADAFGVGEEGVGVGGTGVGDEKFRLGLAGEGAEAELGAPGFEVVEVDVGGEVLAAGVGVGVGAGDELVEKVAAEGAAGAAVIDFGGGVAVVDGEHGAGFPARDPVGEPGAVAVEDFEALAILPGVGEEGGVGEVGGGEPGFGEGVALREEEEFLVGVVELRGAEDAGREGVGDFVGVEEGLAVGGIKGGGGGVVPGDFVAEEILLEFAEDGGALDDVEMEAEAGEEGKGAADGVGEGAVAGADFDDVAEAVGLDPVGEGLAEGIGEGGGGGEVGAAADVGDAGGVVAVGGIVKGELHEAVEAEAAVGVEMGVEPGGHLGGGSWNAEVRI